jgi:phosphoenolpyruvate---glycerone phosphotransferase subunit DhaL
VSSLTAQEVRAMLVHVARRMEESESVLTDADRATGDGDHGIGIARGFEAVRRELADAPADTVGELLDATGRTLLASVGGASGILFGMFFRGGAAALGSRETFDADALRLFLTEGTAEVRKRGKAAPGDKTMVDALVPAAEAAAVGNEDSFAAMLSAASEAARRGVEETKGMVARTGKARSLGERSVGHADPGALSASLILGAMAEFVSGRD